MINNDEGPENENRTKEQSLRQDIRDLDVIIRASSKNGSVAKGSLLRLGGHSSINS